MAIFFNKVQREKQNNPKSINGERNTLLADEASRSREMLI